VATYKLAYDKEISDELRRRFAADIFFLEREGFRSSSLHQEIIYPFSVLTFFPIFLAMRAGNEIIKIEPPLRISSFHLTFFSQTHATYAYVYGLGCKFYTNFSDGTWLVSNTALDVNDKSVIVIKRNPEFTLTTEFVWQRHQEKISEQQLRGRHLNHNVSFEAWAKLDQRFDQSSLSSIMSIGLVWSAGVIVVLYWLISKFIGLAGSG
jgi:hypothetical protein